MKKGAYCKAPVVQLSPDEVEELEKKLRAGADAWGYEVESDAVEVAENVVNEPWIHGQRPGIRRKISAALKKGASKIAQSLAKRRANHKT